MCFTADAVKTLKHKKCTQLGLGYGVWVEDWARQEPVTTGITASSELVRLVKLVIRSIKMT